MIEVSSYDISLYYSEMSVVLTEDSEIVQGCRHSSAGAGEI